ncbi:S-adenosyl-L-methionine-dependent methyltransferase [Jimgerdemannia flammicorona]|uniref:S-adenosyl-L-methionine-dependent methyltransferase n=1 Tax=Jimgerdemannia flammicorona TaxID=994334 RepID=A0A433DB20_9FUNG|nr:S-adenosyl-L-methionine-dependent methyltransferase [Jimgerdemannia flammicorona]
MLAQNIVPKINEIAVTGFNLQAEAYECRFLGPLNDTPCPYCGRSTWPETARPSYPDAAVALLKENLHLVPGQSHVLDLAAGTGKFTRLIAGHGYRLSAVEPAPVMREKFATVLPDVPIQEGTAWKIPFKDQSLDAVIIAQAFHWFDDLPALREIRRVLKPGGYLGLIWNMEDKNARQWVARIRSFYEVYDTDVPQYRNGGWRKVWKTDEAASLFHPMESQFVYHETLDDYDTIWRRVLSKSYVSVLPKDKLEEIRKGIFAVLEDPEGDIEIDPATGLVRFPYETEVVWVQRKD